MFQILLPGDLLVFLYCVQNIFPLNCATENRWRSVYATLREFTVLHFVQLCVMHHEPYMRMLSINDFIHILLQLAINDFKKCGKIGRP